MNDIFGNRLDIGDMVACTSWNGKKTVNELVIAKVVGFTPKKIRVRLEDNELTTKYPNQVAKKFVKNPFEDSVLYMNEVLQMPEDEVKQTADNIYNDIVSKMDY